MCKNCKLYNKKNDTCKMYGKLVQNCKYVTKQNVK